MADFESRENRAFAYEIKFLIPVEQAPEVRAMARACLQPDPNTASGAGDVYRITSLYYDTYGFDVFHRRGSFGRAKFRVRRYDSSPRVFLERKLRSHSIVTKRRTLVDVDELCRLREFEPDPAWAGSWFHRRMLARALNPACQISYCRTALVSENSAGTVRLTLDEDLRASRVSHPEYLPVAGGKLLLRDHAILEMKFRMALPALFKQIMEEFRLRQRPVSKYSLAVTGLGCAPSCARLELGCMQREVAYA
ncbi:MAG: polyphosphate polymerase domain-containing protein [Candidatus Solibacter sp.]|nr:polyphosphate polymerase domain-containing protein [Candidatus Solibacter sp.]